MVTWTSHFYITSGAPFGFALGKGQARLFGSSFGIPGVNRTYDYVVVGGGTAGLTIAKRLAEKSDISVAVVEAGSFYEIDNGNTSQIPAADITYSGSIITPVDWNIVTQPQPGYNGRSMHYSQGKCLGGSSALNDMAGTKGTFQMWADLVGDPSYTWDNVLPFYKKSIDFVPPNLEKIGPGFNMTYDSAAFDTIDPGPLHLSYSNYQQPIGTFISKSLEKLGLKGLPGLNSGSLLGFAPSTMTIDPTAETRDSSETSFLQDAMSNTYLQVYQRTLAKTILFDSERRANGVNVETDGAAYVLSARKEVVVSAGAIHSPQLLMVSGIGPAATLQKLGIPVLSDLQGVGQQLWDQPVVFPSFHVNVTTNTQLLTNPGFAARATEAYLSNQTGPLTSVNGDILVFEKLPEANRASLSPSTLSFLAGFPADFPEIEYIPFAVGSLPPTAQPTDNYMSIGAVILTTQSRGNVTINSTDTAVRPIISPNWFLASADLEVAVQAFRRAREIAHMSGIVIKEYSPGAAVESDPDIRQWIKENASLTYHASATCAMGTNTCAGAVVDSKARVYGVSKLRVVDASVFPFLPPGHPQSTVYMLAEKVAQDILAEL
ncbi:hypothetical protein MMC16_004075 [Acarospora aff. strigata]|nr:hypothetical protein [Acarospora aff. strigata]